VTGKAKVQLPKGIDGDTMPTGVRLDHEGRCTTNEKEKGLQDWDRLQRKRNAKGYLILNSMGKKGSGLGKPGGTGDLRVASRDQID